MEAWYDSSTAPSECQTNLPDDTRTESLECNAEMLARTCRQADQVSADVRLGAVFDAGPLRRSIAAAVLLAATVVGFAVLCPEAFAVWTIRNVKLSDELWPR